MKGREKLTGRKQLVYVVDFGDGIVKIGRTRRPQGRMSELLKGRNGTPVHMYVTPKMPNACSVEKAALEWLGCDFPRAIGREWFNAPVAEAIAVVNQAALVYGWPDKKTALKYHPAIRARPELLGVIEDLTGRKRK